MVGRPRSKNKKESFSIAMEPNLARDLDNELQGKPRSPFVVKLILDFLRSTKKRE